MSITPTTAYCPRLVSGCDCGSAYCTKATEPIAVKPSGYFETKRLLRGNRIVGLVQECSNGKWVLEDANGKSICAKLFRNPTAAGREAERMGLGL